MINKPHILQSWEAERPEGRKKEKEQRFYQYYPSSKHGTLVSDKPKYRNKKERRAAKRERVKLMKVLQNENA